MATEMPKITDHTISNLKWLWANSCPPLKPIENKRYSEMNFEVLSGISKSLLSLVAMIPRRKNNKAGLVRLSNNKFRFMALFFNLLRIYSKNSSLPVRSV